MAHRTRQSQLCSLTASGRGMSSQAQLGGIAPSLSSGLSGGTRRLPTPRRATTRPRPRPGTVSIRRRRAARAESGRRATVKRQARRSRRAAGGSAGVTPAGQCLWVCTIRTGSRSASTPTDTNDQPLLTQTSAVPIRHLTVERNCSCPRPPVHSESTDQRHEIGRRPCDHVRPADRTVRCLPAGRGDRGGVPAPRPNLRGHADPLVPHARRQSR